MSISFIAGLGNPGAEYTATRHNVGFRVVEALAARAGAQWQRQAKLNVELATVDLAGQRVTLLKPQLFMNRSGRVLGQYLRFFKARPEQLAVVYDEVNVNLGTQKISLRGSAGGHNGIADLLTHVGDGFIRFRVGVGPKEPPQMSLTDFVLGKFREEENQTLVNNMPAFLDGLVLLVDKGPTVAMNRLNRKKENNDSDERS